MGTRNYERLSALDAAFLVLESPTTPMHIGSISILDGGSLVDGYGAVDIDRIATHLATCLNRLPRYQRIGAVFRFVVRFCARATTYKGNHERRAEVAGRCERSTTWHVLCCR